MGRSSDRLLVDLGGNAVPESIPIGDKGREGYAGRLIFMAGERRSTPGKGEALTLYVRGHSHYRSTMGMARRGKGWTPRAESTVDAGLD